MTDKLALQQNEFSALERLCKTFNNLPAVVDDDYPEMRHLYESALTSFISAMNANHRFNPGNRYRLGHTDSRQQAQGEAQRKDSKDE